MLYEVITTTLSAVTSLTLIVGTGLVVSTLCVWVVVALPVLPAASVVVITSYSIHYTKLYDAGNINAVVACRIHWNTWLITH